MKISGPALLIGCLLLLVFTSCKKSEDPCDTAIPTCSCAYIGIVDSEGNSLLGPDNVYKPSEISLSRKGQVIDLIVDDLGGTDLYLKFFLSTVISGEDYLLQLSSTETDIVSMDIIEQSDACFTTFEVQEFRQNGVVIEINGEFILIEK